MKNSVGGQVLVDQCDAGVQEVLDYWDLFFLLIF